MHEFKFQDFGLNFQILEKSKSPTQLQKIFVNEIKNIDPVLFKYYQNFIKSFHSIYFVLSMENSNNKEVGYARIVIDEFYWNLYEIFIENDLRELGLGTYLFEYINNLSQSKKADIRTYALPSDRQAKNFYESNSITAKLLIMERKREHNRYRP
ncbi:MAG: GNAT family N-acetyltransferase [Candidatus Actinomarina sp.]